MAKPKSADTKKRPTKSKVDRVEPTKYTRRSAVVSASGQQTSASESKQERVIAMLQSPTGTTITAMMQVTGWQKHSVRGFLAGVVRKRLKLKLASNKIDGTRIYSIGTGRAQKQAGSQSKRRTA
jgi:hypothetical protein